MWGISRRFDPSEGVAVHLYSPATWYDRQIPGVYPFSVNLTVLVKLAQLSPKTPVQPFQVIHQPDPPFSTYHKLT